MPYTISLLLLATGTLKVSYCSNFDELCAVNYPYRDTMCEEAPQFTQATYSREVYTTAQICNSRPVHWFYLPVMLE